MGAFCAVLQTWCLVGLHPWGIRGLKCQSSAAVLLMFVDSLHWKGDQIANLIITNAMFYLN